MYGWLDTSLCAARAWFTDPSERCLRTTPTALVQWLPLLGSVLYVPSRMHADSSARLPNGLLSESPLLTPLLRTSYLRVLGMVSADGPREWIECLDVRGEILAELHLLPDTDYLAWDNLPSESVTIDSVPRYGRARMFRGAATHLIRFRCQSLATITCLGEALPPRISSLGRVIAQAIAGAQPLLLHGSPMLP
ncbi:MULTISPECIES: hypothetical protein [unclassified Rhodanobacter]|uniref:hypothetical protein n=1 Tax=unclassified Rhodanobacter TaxID=2621553 RepID=UPI00161D761E|nr:MULTISPECIES: hypothetical protein [unclassified Rhodanobacter]MBB6242824.1 hypothetical protein [Rhodanobacter sp. MP1X3]MBB6245361.1 hypothetical protein [Rhodanobacter sp. A1T4]